MSRTLTLVLCLGALAMAAFGQSAVPHFMGIGDSLGEGDQSANAFTLSQQQTYLNYVATQAGFPFTQPLISSSAIGFVGTSVGRSRISTSVNPDDLAVSGAKVSDVLNTTASKHGGREVDLVLAPYYGMSQIQIVQQQKPENVFCWVGNDDLINYVLDFSHLNNPTGITSLADFTTDYQMLMADLKATGAKVVVANIPDLTKVGFLFDNNDVTKYLGQNYNLPAGSLTTLGAVILIKLGVDSSSILSNPAYVLTGDQVTNIQTQIQAYNAVILQAANAQGFPVVDAFSIVDSYISNPLTIEGITISTHYNGGAFSLDGIHPSDTGYAIFANAFIKQANQTYGTSIPVITTPAEIAIFNADPFVDFNQNGVVPGRPKSGLLETLGPKLGLSGDTNDQPPATVPAKSALTVSPSAKPSAASFMSAYFEATGRNPNSRWEATDLENAVKEMLGAPR